MKRRTMLNGAVVAAAMAAALWPVAPPTRGPAPRRSSRRPRSRRTPPRRCRPCTRARTVPEELASKARGILVFPKVYAGGLGIGGEYGEGVLHVGGKTVDYYKTTSVSFGFQAGAQSKALVFMFMTQDALDKFRSGKGWTAGADASVALVKIGANGTIDTSSAGAAVNAFALANGGLMFAATIDGTKVSKIEF